MDAPKTLKDCSELEKLTMPDAEFEAALEASVDELIEHMQNAGRELSVSWRQREPEAAARLDQWEIDNPEAFAARERAGVLIHKQAKDSAMDAMGSHWREKRAQFRDLSSGTSLPKVESVTSHGQSTGEQGIEL